MDGNLVKGEPEDLPEGVFQVKHAAFRVCLFGVAFELLIEILASQSILPTP